MIANVRLRRTALATAILTVFMGASFLQAESVPGRGIEHLINGSNPRPGLAVWSDGAATIPMSSPWYGSAFVGQSGTADVGTWRIMAGAAAPARKEAILLGVDGDRNISGQIFDGAWSAFPFNDLATVSESFWWGFDVAYEQQSGDAVIVWNNGRVDDRSICYRVWDGGFWSAVDTITVPLAGEPLQMKLAANPLSDEMVLVVSNALQQDYALVWDGDGWGHPEILSLGSGDNHTDVYAAYEAQSGRALVVYGIDDTDVYGRLWTGSEWQAAGVLSKPAGVFGKVRFTTLGSDPGSDRIAVGVLANDLKVWLSVWDGAVWEPAELASSMATGTIFPNVAVAFEGQSGRALAAYGNFGLVHYRVWNDGPGWSDEAFAVDQGIPNSIFLAPAPDSDQVMLAYQDFGSIFRCVLWDGADWQEPDVLASDTGEIKNQPFVFLWTRAGVDLQLTKRVDDSNPSAGDSVSFTVTAMNGGSMPATGVMITDQLPAGLTYLSHTASQGSYSDVTGLWDVGGLAAGVSVTLELVAEVDAGAAGTIITNTAAVTGLAETDLSSANDAATARIYVPQTNAYTVTPMIDSWLHESKPTENNGDGNEMKCKTKPGDNWRPVVQFDLGFLTPGTNVLSANVQYYVKHKDDSGFTIDIHRITDIWTEFGVDYANTGLDYDAGTVHGSFLADADGLVTADVTSLVQEWADGSFPNYGMMLVSTADDVDSRYATKEDGDPAKWPTLHVVTAGMADLHINKVVDNATPGEGEQVIFTVTLVNNGPDNGTAIEVTDVMQAGLSYVSHTVDTGSFDSGSGVWDVGNLAVGGTAELTLTVEIDAGTAGSVLTNGAAVTSAEQGDLDPGNNSDAAAVTVTGAKVLVVNTTSDEEDGTVASIAALLNDRGADGMISLREAIKAANNSPNGAAPDTIKFNIGGGGIQTIQPVSILPPITDPVILDATTQPGFAAKPLIELDGSGFSGGDANGLTLQAGNSVIRGFVINRFDDDAIEIDVNGGNTIVGNYIGTDVTGMAPLANKYGINVKTSGNIIGGAASADRNVISGNTNEGLYIYTNAATGNVVTGNFIGVDATGSGALGNGSHGIYLTDNARNNTIGGPDPGEGNIIASNTGGGIVLSDTAGADNAIVGNSIVANTGLGIDLGNDGITGNDLDDSDDGPNGRLNFPEITAAAMSGGIVDADFDLDLPAGFYRIEFFTNPSGSDPSGNGEGEMSAASVVIEHTGSGVESFAHSFAGSEDDTLTATSTECADGEACLTCGSTSEFSAAVDVAGGADLKLMKVVDDPMPDEGDTITYTVTLTNNGPDVGAGIEVTDLLPAGVIFVSDIPSQGVYDDGTGVWDVGAVATGAGVDLQLTATVAAGTGGGTITNTAAVTAMADFDPDASNDSTSVDITVRSSDLKLTKIVSNPSPIEGAVVTYGIDLVNNGPHAATGIAVSDLLPAGVTYQGHTSTQGTYDNGTGVWDIGALAAAATAGLSIDVQVDAGTTGSTIVNTASISACGTADPDGSNNGDSAELTVRGLDLELTKNVDNPTPNEGDNVVYSVTVANHGPDAATAISVTDTLPAGVSYVSAVATQGAFDPDLHLWAVGNLANGASATLDLTAVVESGTASQTIANAAGIFTVTESDIDPANDSASADLTVKAVDLRLEKIVDDPAPNEADTVRFTLSLSNLGPDDGTGITVSDLLPDGVTFVAATPGLGSYDPGTGIWDVDDLANGANAVLNIDAIVDAGTTGSIIVNSAGVLSAVEADPDGSNNSGSAAVAVQGADLQVEKTVDVSRPKEFDTVAYTVTVSNQGPNDATGIQVQDVLPAGLSYVSSTPSQGGYDTGTGIWMLGNLASGGSATLVLTVVIDVGTAGQTIANTAEITTADQADPAAANDIATVEVTVQSVDLKVTKSVSDSEPFESQAVTYAVIVINHGPDAASGVQVADLLPAGVTYLDAVTTQGSYDPGTGIWGDLAIAASDSAKLTIDVEVDPGTSGAIISNTATIAASDQTDSEAGNDVDTASITVQEAPPAGQISVRAVPQEIRPLRPGGQAMEVMRLEVISEATVNDTLTGLVLKNSSVGPGSQAQLDADWQRLSLLIDPDGLPAPPDPVEVATGDFAAGQLVFSDLDVAVAPGDTLQLIVEGQASYAARDGDVLAVAIDRAEDIGFNLPVTKQDGTWPLAGQADLVVDGFVADQLDLRAIDPVIFPVGSIRNLALDVGLPPNGYEGDALDRLNVINDGDAQVNEDIVGLEAWADAGDGAFDADTDILLGRFAYTGNRWELTGLNHEVPLEGLRIYVTVDISPDATEGRTIRLGLPTLPDVGIGMASGNDGPIDREVFNPFAQAVSASDRVFLTQSPIAPGTLYPGAEGARLLHVIATNTYAEDRQLIGLTVANQTMSAGPASRAELDGECEQLKLRVDGNGNGLLDLDDFVADPVVGEATFVNGQAVFAGLAWDLPTGGSRHLFLTADVSLLGASDGDVIAGNIVAGSDLSFSEPTAVVAAWPVDSGARWTVNGLVADQVQNRAVPSVSLAAGDGPILAMDLVIPANGYADDTFTGLEVVNLGSATTSDVVDLRLWRDGGNGLFDPGSGDDVELGPLVWLGASYRSVGLSEPVSIAGQRLFVGLTVSNTPTDSATVQLAVPLGGILYESGNDGPIDRVIESPTTLLLSTAPLLATVEVGLSISTIGMEVPVRMVVRNVGGEDVVDLTPSNLFPEGAGGLTLTGGPQPAALDLPSGQQGVFTWTYTAQTVGEVRLTGFAEGTGAVGGLQRRSWQHTSSSHSVLNPVSSLGLYPVANMPFSINRGQPGVVPLTLTLINAGGAQVADARLQRLRIRLEDENGGGIVPAELLSRVVVNEGTNTYLDKNDLETTGSEIELPLTAPALVTGREPVTLGIRLDISAATVVPSFRVTIADSTWLETYDNVSGAPVPLSLQHGGYPIESGLGRLVTEATDLDVAAVASALRRAGQGQQDVELMRLRLQHSGVDELSSDVQVGSFTLGLTDTNGIAIGAPNQILDHIVARGPFQILCERALTAGDDSSLTLFLSPPLSVPVNTPVELILTGDLTETAPLGAFRVCMGDSANFDARDGNTAAPVPIRYAAEPLAGAAVLIEAAASEIAAQGDPALPPRLTIGARQVAALTVKLRHPGPGGTAAVRVDSMTVLFRDEMRNPLAPMVYIDRLAAVVQSVPVGSVSDPAAAGGALMLPLGGLLLEPGESITLSLEIDIEASAPASGLELMVPGDGIRAFDNNLGHAVAVAPETGEEFPLTSGLTRLQPPADELVVGMQSRMPAVLAARPEELSVAALTLSNPAEDEVGSIDVRRLTLRAADHQFHATPIGDAIAELFAYHRGQLWAGSGDLAQGDTVAELAAPEPLTIEGGDSAELDIRVVFRGDILVDNIRVGLERDDIDVLQPDGALLAIRIVPIAGHVFPFWTEVGNFSGLGLAESYSNFPNPFAAGRERTTFAFNLQNDAKVTLRILTPRGATVTTLLDEVWRSSGLYQEDDWEGLNGRGVTVRSGVYVAELVVRYDNGKQEKILRKVAVVR